uniref:Uncharacterized protein n=1 Tax=Cacopsylla melanoneura TaxID=428564 RepID=A0A8D9EIT5_9HEMI
MSGSARKYCQKLHCHEEQWYTPLVLLQQNYAILDTTIVNILVGFEYTNVLHIQSALITVGTALLANCKLCCTKFPFLEPPNLTRLMSSSIVADGELFRWNVYN